MKGIKIQIILIIQAAMLLLSLNTVLVNADEQILGDFNILQDINNVGSNWFSQTQGINPVSYKEYDGYRSFYWNDISKFKQWEQDGNTFKARVEYNKHIPFKKDMKYKISYQYKLINSEDLYFSMKIGQFTEGMRWIDQYLLEEESFVGKKFTSDNWITKTFTVTTKTTDLKGKNVSPDTENLYLFFDVASLSNNGKATGSGGFEIAQIKIEEMKAGPMPEETTDSKKDKDISVLVNQNKIEFDVQPTIINGRTLVPLRNIFEALNMKVDWDDKEKTISASDNSSLIELKIDDTIAKANSKEIKLEVPPQIINSRTLVPVRFISESVGARVEWEEYTKTIDIYTKDFFRVQDTTNPVINLENDRLKVSFDTVTALANVTDKRTSTVWRQFYSQVPTTQIIKDSKFLSRWGTEWHAPATYSNVPSVKTYKGYNSLSYDVSTFIATPVIGGNTSRVEAKSFSFTPASHTVKYKIKAKDISNVKFTSKIAFFGASGYLQTIVYDTNEFETPTNFDWQEKEFSVSADKIDPNAKTAILFWDVDSENGKGSGEFEITAVQLIPTEGGAVLPFNVSDAQKGQDNITFNLSTAERAKKNLPPFKVTLALNNDKIDYNIDCDIKSDFSSGLDYPPPFHSAKTDLWWVLTHNEGMMLPAADITSDGNRKFTGGDIYESASGFNMPWVGGLNLDTSDGYMQVINTPIESGFQYLPSRFLNRTSYAPFTYFKDEKGLFGFKRGVSCIFIDNGGYVAMTKRYQQIAKDVGYYVTLKQKTAKNPNAERGVGAPIFWLHENYDNQLKIVEDMKKNGIEKAVIHVSGGDLHKMEKTPMEQSEINLQKLIKKIDSLGYISSKYDNYRDTYNPEQLKEHNNAAWTADFLVKNKNMQYITGWVFPDGSAARLMCQSKIALDFMLKNKYLIEYDKFKLTGRFIDVVGSTSPKEAECYSPEHPATAREIAANRQYLLGFFENRDVYVGTECSADYLVPYHYFSEGTMTNIKLTDMDGIPKLTDNIETGDSYKQYSIGEYYRIPLWELVYHGCTEVTWHWEDGNYQPKEYWGKKDLFNILYGTKQLNFINLELYNKLKNKFVESSKKVYEVNKKTVYEEMKNHQFLTKDRKVQMTEYSSGVKVYVNFGMNQYINGDIKISPNSYLVTE